METIDPSDVSRVLTIEQLGRGAEGVGYRAQQLAHVTMLTRSQTDYPRGWQTINNARIESALIHSRALAYLLTSSTKHAKYNLSIRHYSISTWAAESISGRNSEPHSGAWPIPEIAVFLTRGLADFVEALRARFPDRAALFDERPPSQHYQRLMESDPLAAVIPISEHPDVGDLTKSLQTYLARPE
jgi:hypothetical protein